MLVGFTIFFSALSWTDFGQYKSAVPIHNLLSTNGFCIYTHLGESSLQIIKKKQKMKLNNFQRIEVLHRTKMLIWIDEYYHMYACLNKVIKNRRSLQTLMHKNNLDKFNFRPVLSGVSCTKENFFLLFLTFYSKINMIRLQSEPVLVTLKVPDMKILKY